MLFAMSFPDVTNSIAGVQPTHLSLLELVCLELCLRLLPLLLDVLQPLLEALLRVRGRPDAAVERIQLAVAVLQLLLPVLHRDLLQSLHQLVLPAISVDNVKILQFFSDIVIVTVGKLPKFNNNWLSVVTLFDAFTVANSISE